VNLYRNQPLGNPERNLEVMNKGNRLLKQEVDGTGSVLCRLAVFCISGDEFLSPFFYSKCMII
jgi:hypothetical protein